MKRLLALAALLLLTACGAPAAADPTYIPGDDEGVLTNAVTMALGDSNREVERVASVKLKGDKVTVKWAINDNMGDDLIVRSSRMDVIKILKALEESDVVYLGAHLVGTFPLVDKKGNSEEETVLDATFDSTEFADVNWDGISNDDVLDLASKVKLHPAFE